MNFKKHEYINRSWVQAIQSEIKSLENSLIARDEQTETQLNNKIKTLKQKLDFLIILMFLIISIFNPVMLELIKVMI